MFWCCSLALPNIAIPMRERWNGISSARPAERTDEALCKLHLTGDRETNKMRDLAFGLCAGAAGVSIATLAPGSDDIAVDRTTTDAARLKSAATQFATRTFAAFGADVDQLTEVFRPFNAEPTGSSPGRPERNPLRKARPAPPRHSGWAKPSGAITPAAAPAASPSAHA